MGRIRPATQGRDAHSRTPEHGWPSSSDGLPALEGYPFAVRYSEGARVEAIRLADLAKDAHAYFTRLLPDTQPTFTARFLAPADWPEGYGMPAYDPDSRSLRVATEDNRFWQSFGRIARIASPLGAYPRLKTIYGGADGRLQLRRFFDLIAVHELAHAYEHETLARFPALWLSEVFANVALHAFVAAERPAEWANLTTFPQAMSRIAAFNALMRLRGFRGLEDFERHYPVGTEAPMSGANYGWYQIRFLVLGREVFEEGGEAALSRLWAFGQSHDARRVSPWTHYLENRTLTGWTLRMPRRELADVLGSQVSPRLGQAIAGWK